MDQTAELQTADLVRRAQKADRQALEAIASSAQERLLDYAIRLCRSREDAEDAVQEAIVIFLRKLHTLRDPERLYSWLGMILRNCVLSRIRRQRRVRLLDEGGEADIEAMQENPLDGLEADEFRKDFRDCVQRLTEETRAVLVQNKLKGRTLEDIAHRLGIPNGTVRSRCFRAMQSLRTCLESKGYGDAR